MSHVDAINNMQIPSEEYDWQGKEFLNEGAFGKVYKVKRRDGEKVAVKVLAKSNFPDEESLQLLADEIRVQRELKHEHIAQLYDVMTDPDYCFIVMELCEGSLRDNLDKQGKLPVATSCELFRQLMSGVQFMVSK
jgi:serine/threonine protein kinase